MLRKMMIALFALTPMMAMAAPIKLSMDIGASKVQWQGSKALVKDTHTGTVKLDSSSFLLVEGLQIVGGEIVIDMMSIKNEDVKDPKANAKLIGHLYSSDFFNTTDFKTAKFVIKKVTPQPDGKTLFEGTMTIRGNSQPANILATVEKVKDQTNIWTAKGKMDFDRTKFDIRYNSKDFFPDLVKTGKDKVINNEINLTFDIRTGAK